jgi:hypothetical protein
MKLRMALPIPRAEAVLVRAARAGGDAVHVAADVLVGRLGPEEGQVEFHAALVALARLRERRVVHRRRGAVLRRSSGGSPRALVVLEDDASAPARLVLEDDLQSLVQIARDLEPLADDRRIELDLREDRRVGPGRTPSCPCRARAELLRQALRHALLEALLPLSRRRV